jgi:predicted nucleic acid-binding protein
LGRAAGEAMSGQADGYMLDTNVFNDVADGKISLEAFDSHRVFATHVQLDELSASKSERAAALLKEFERIGPTEVSTTSATWDASKWDQSGWTPEDGCYQKISARLHELDVQAGKKHRDWKNPVRDALIADTAIRRGLVVVTGDENLRCVVEEFGGEAIDLDTMAKCGRSDDAS